MAYKGKYQPSHPRKYKGDPTNIIYRSLWERKFMVYCDNNENILEWRSDIASHYLAVAVNALKIFYQFGSYLTASTYYQNFIHHQLL